MDRTILKVGMGEETLNDATDMMMNIVVVDDYDDDDIGYCQDNIMRDAGNQRVETLTHTHSK
jgi:hypothetical protein